jgi:hypothetical protein
MHSWQQNLSHLGRLAKRYTKKLTVGLICKLQGHNWMFVPCWAGNSRRCKWCGETELLELMRTKLLLPPASKDHD